jgi:hypothetical protein
VGNGHRRGAFAEVDSGNADCQQQSGFTEGIEATDVTGTELADVSPD